MSNTLTTQPIWLKAAALFALVFGAMTLFSGGSVLLSDAAREAAGQTVGFVVWFNFLAGFAYIIAGAGLWLGRRWAAQLALAIAATTLLVFALFGLYVLSGGAFEMRTMIALPFRAAVWLGLFALARLKNN
jgi:hypothetical protein